MVWCKCVYLFYTFDTAQAHQTVCQQWHEWVLGRKAQASADGWDGAGSPDGAGAHEREHEITDAVTQQQQGWRLPQQFVQLRPVQRDAMNAIWDSHIKSKKESRITTTVCICVFARARLHACLHVCNRQL